MGYCTMEHYNIRLDALLLVSLVSPLDRRDRITMCALRSNLSFDDLERGVLTLFTVMIQNK